MHKDQTFWVTAKIQDGCADSQTNITAQPAEMKWVKWNQRMNQRGQQVKQSKNNKAEKTK